jgi:glutamyl-Q tRNA(Asp) synthetase
MSADQPVFRFAPSPNGLLHLGHARSALVGFRAARRMGGRFLLRIEDIDTIRTRDDYVAAIFEDLAWLGIVWEEPVLRQSRHFSVYQRAARQLAAEGLLYPCFATRREIAAAADPKALDPEGTPLYPGLHRGLTPTEIAARQQRGEPFAWRLDMQRALAVATARLGGKPLTFQEGVPGGAAEAVAAQPARWGDAVIVRKDTPASYHLAVVVDDARQGVTHVTRGMDLFAATDIHRLLQVLLDLPAPVYHHHSLVTDEIGRKLAKSAGDISLRALRAAGMTPADVERLAGVA